MNQLATPSEFTVSEIFFQLQSFHTLIHHFGYLIFAKIKSKEQYIPHMYIRGQMCNHFPTIDPFRIIQTNGPLARQILVHIIISEVCS